MPYPSPGNKHIRKLTWAIWLAVGLAPELPYITAYVCISSPLCYLSSDISQCPHVFQDSWEDVIFNLRSAQHEVAQMVKKEGA